jgi:hypothetical protein
MGSDQFKKPFVQLWKPSLPAGIIIPHPLSWVSISAKGLII